MAAVQKTPAGPWTDYSRSLVAGEEVVGAIIDQILTDGGTALWQKYLERRAFGFASEVVAEAVVSKLKMCFVAHDQGEENGDEVWDLEDEPEPGEIDSWARMHMNVRRMPGAGDGAPAGAGNSNRARSLGNTVRSQQASSFRSMRSADTKTRTTARTPGRSERTEERARRLEDEKDEDDEEKRLRDAKSQEEVRRRERAKRAREAEQQLEDEAKKVEALHEEMSRRPHTFDTEGNIIWVEEFKAYPKVQEIAGYSVKKDPKAKAMEERGGKLDSSASASGKQDSSANKDDTVATKSSSRRNPGGGGKPKVRVAQDLEFTDGYSKLQYGQPPILDTMNVQQGVVIEAGGKKKSGIPDNHERSVMSRKEYNQLAEQEMASGGYPGAGMSSHATEATQPSNTAAATAAAADGAGRQASQGKGDGGPAAAAAAGKGAAAAATTAAPAGGGVAPGGGAAGVSAPSAGGAHKLPPLNGAASQGRAATSKAKDKSKDDPDAPPMQRAPPAPPRETRHMGQKMALGSLAFQRAPRYHHPALGGSTGMGPPPPPLGATMGHGLVRHGSLKEDYFFPPSMPDLSLPLQRSTSETALGGTHSRSQMLGSARGSSRGGAGVGPLAGTPKGGGGTPKGGLPPGGLGEAHHGHMRTETMSPAYRNFRSQLCPEPPATTAVGGGGGSNFGSRGNF